MASTVRYFLFSWLFIAGCCYTCVSKVIQVSTSDQLRSALLQASPGDNISLCGNTTFQGSFVATQNGSLLLPITILTDNFEKTYYAKLDGTGARNLTTFNETPTLHIQGNYYRIENVKITNENSLGVLIDGKEVTLDGVLVQNASRGVWTRGSQSYLRDCAVSGVQEGIRLDGDFAIVRDSFVTGTGIVSVSAGKESCCGTLMGNVLDSKVELLGTDFNLFDNVIAGKSQ